MADLKRTVQDYHPARASSDVASSLAPSPGRLPAPEGARSARRGVLRLQSARCSIRPVITQAHDGGWTVDPAAFTIDANAIDTLVGLALASL